MYVFTSAIFFLIFFSMGKEENVIRVTDTSRNAADIVKSLEKKKKNYQESLRDSMPALARKPIEKALAVVDSDLVLIRKDTTAKNSLRSIKGNFNFMGGTAGTDYSNVAAYDSAQAAMPEEQRDSYIERRFVRQNIHLKEAYNSDGSAILKAILKKFKNLFPQILFLSLPLLALALQLLYVRRKKFYYVNHVIFTIHLYCGTFIIILAGMALEGIFRIFGYSAPEWVNVVLTIGGFFYWYKSMRNFYEQRRAKTILKYMLLLFLGLLIMTLLFTIFFIFSAMSI